jgi:hypothetical protein
MARNPGEPPEPRSAPTVSQPERIWHRLGRARRGGREEQSL